ncbi:hypothetical protein [Bacteroides sedimenti]|uniref:hypothetical protein n=1 Tax=Bacteroides sedimenti TaxID=2136147 RepID=UPI00333F4D49
MITTHHSSVTVTVPGKSDYGVAQARPLVHLPRWEYGKSDYVLPQYTYPLFMEN